MSNLQLEAMLAVIAHECFNRLTVCFEISVIPADQISMLRGSKKQLVVKLEIPYPSHGLLLRHQELLLNKGVAIRMNKQKTCLLLQMRVEWLIREAMTYNQDFPSFK